MVTLVIKMNLTGHHWEIGKQRCAETLSRMTFQYKSVKYCIPWPILSSAFYFLPRTCLSSSLSLSICCSWCDTVNKYIGFLHSVAFSCYIISHSPTPVQFSASLFFHLSDLYLHLPSLLLLSNDRWPSCCGLRNEATQMQLLSAAIFIKLT